MKKNIEKINIKKGKIITSKLIQKEHYEFLECYNVDNLITNDYIFQKHIILEEKWVKKYE